MSYCSSGAVIVLLSLLIATGKSDRSSDIQTTITCLRFLTNS